MTMKLIEHMQKGETTHDWTVITVTQNVGTHNGKNLHEVLLTKGGINGKAVEVTENGSQFLRFINKNVSFVVLSPGRDGKPTWIKIEDNFLAANGMDAGISTAKVYSDMLYLARDAMKWSTSLCAADVITLDEVEAKAEQYARFTVTLANKLIT